MLAQIQSFKDLNYSKLDRLQSKFDKRARLYVLAFTAGFIIIIILGIITPAQQSGSVSAFFLLWLFGFIAAGMIIESRREQANANAVSQFAEDNGLAFTPYNHTVRGRDGSVFKLGSTATAHNYVEGVYQGNRFQLFNYRYTVGSGKNAKMYDLAVFELVLPHAIPHIVIDSKVEPGNDSMGSSTLPVRFDKDQRIELEGDFSQYFNLFAPDKHGVTALELLAPDVMDAMMRHAAHCDIEIVGRRLYFYWPKEPETAGDYRKMLAVVEAVWEEIRKKLTGGRLGAPPKAAAAHVHISPAPPLLKSNKFFSDPGSLFVIMFVALIFLTTFIPLFTDGMNDRFTPLAVPAMFLTIPVYLIVRRYRRKKLAHRLKLSNHEPLK